MHIFCKLQHWPCNFQKVPSSGEEIADADVFMKLLAFDFSVKLKFEQKFHLREQLIQK